MLSYYYSDTSINNHYYNRKYNQYNNHHNYYNQLLNNPKKEYSYDTVNNKLFYLVWKNIYLKKIIMDYVKVLNMFHYKREFNSMDHLLKFQYCQYLQDVKLNILDQDCVDLSLLPASVEYLTFNIINSISAPPTIMNLQPWLVSIRIPFMNMDYLKPILQVESLKYLHLMCMDHHGEINEFGDLYFCEQLDELSLMDYSYQIQSGTLPRLLKKLTLTSRNDQDQIIKRYALPTSLTYLNVSRRFNNCIQMHPETLPQGLLYFKTRSEIFNIDNNSFFTNYPSSIISLELYCKRNFKLPSSLQFLKIFIQKQVVDIPFPDSIVQLKITYGDIITRDPIPNYRFNILPKSNLKSIVSNIKTFVDINGYSMLNYGLEKIKLVNSMYFDKTLVGFNKELVPNQFPPTLKILNFGRPSPFNNGGKELKPNVFPDSLTVLKLGSSFNSYIGENVLPSQLKLLVLGRSFQHRLDAYIIPKGLKMIKFKSADYIEPAFFPEHPKLIVESNCAEFYHYNQHPELMTSGKVAKRTLRTPINFSNKTNLEYLHYSSIILNEKTINMNLLPSNNRIKTLKLSYHFSRNINLDDFTQLETIIVYRITCAPIITTSTYIDKEDGTTHYRFYKLKTIYVQINNIQFINNLNPIFHRFIKYMKHNQYVELEDNHDNNNN